MKRSNDQSIKEVIGELLQTYGLDKKLSEKKLIASWPLLVGDTIANHTTDIYISNKKLFLKLDSAVIREELSYVKSKLLDEMEQLAGSRVVEEIIFQ